MTSSTRQLSSFVCCRSSSLFVRHRILFLPPPIRGSSSGCLGCSICFRCRLSSNSIFLCRFCLLGYIQLSPIYRLALLGDGSCEEIFVVIVVFAFIMRINFVFYFFCFCSRFFCILLKFIISKMKLVTFSIGIVLNINSSNISNLIVPLDFIIILI